MRARPDVATLTVHRAIRGGNLTLLWFIVWLVANAIGDREPLLVDPVNWWAGTLLLVVALDLSRQHAPDFGKRR
jgi:hypothetical protein